MKKRLFAFVALMLSVLMCATSLSGCSLVTKDSEKDMGQVIATVDLGDAYSGQITKQELVLAYMNYGYVYTQYYGKTQEETIELLMDSIINTKVLALNAMKQFDEENASFLNADIAKGNPARYLTEEEVIDARYNTLQDIDALLDSYEVAGEEDKKDSLTETVRTVPTNAANAEKEVDKAEFKLDINSTAARRKAYGKVVRLLESYNMLGEGFEDYGNLDKTDYYSRSLESYYTSAVIEKYEDGIQSAARAEFGFADLAENFEKEYKKQQAWSNEDFVSALSSASVSSPVLYSAYGTYGYVYNLLLGVSDEQTEKLNDIDGDLSISEKEAQRKEILAETTVKDLRSSWIHSGYDFDFATKKFTGDYTFAKITEDGSTAAKNSLPFKGDVVELKAKTDDEAGEYDVTPTIYGLDEFIELMDNYVYGAAQTGDASAVNDNIYKQVTYTSGVEEYAEKINELLFAFSTDDGSLNTYKGYVIKPAVDGADSEEYVETFADAGRQLLELGGQSYIIVASDFGYHVMFFSEVYKVGDTAIDGLLDTDTAEEMLVKYLNTVSGESEDKAYWEAKLADIIANYDDHEDDEDYLYLAFNALSSNKVSKALERAETAVTNKYVREGNYVVKYESRYSDLLG